MRSYTIVVILGGLLIFSLWDITNDIYRGVEFWHWIPEILFFLFTGWLFVIFFNKTLNQKKTIEKLISDNKNLREKSKYWKFKTSKIRSNLRRDIEEQLRQWNLSAAEITVAFLIIRGYSFTQIASLLKKSERTVRQQAIEIYKKAGFNTRSEFSAFFIESIFEFEDEDSFFD